MAEVAAQGLMLRDIPRDGTDPVTVFLLAPNKEIGAFVGFEPARRAGSC